MGLRGIPLRFLRSLDTISDKTSAATLVYSAHADELNFETTDTTANNVSIKVEHYSLNGSSAESLIASLNRYGPGDGSGRRFDALTSWSLKVAAGSAVKTCRITVLLPKPVQYSTFDRKFKQKWDLYIRAIEAHEERHVELIKATFLENITNDLNQLAKKITQRNEAFDEHTNHDKQVRLLLSDPIT